MEAIIKPNQKAPDLFKNKFLNLLTWSHPALIFSMYAIIASVMIYIDISSFHARVLPVVGYFLSGVFAWTLAEYLMHRFLYHDAATSAYDKGARYLFHGVHHQYPHDESKVVLPPVPSLIVAAVFFGVFYLIMGKTALAFSPGFMIGYSLYMWIHYAVHNYTSPKRLNFWWKHHNIHHYQQHDRAFGVSTSLWDRVFGTMPERNRKTIKVVLEKSK